MDKRRDVLLNDVCAEVQTAVTRLTEGSQTGTTQSGNTTEEFHPSHYKCDDISELVLNFEKDDLNGDGGTIEGNVLRAVLDTLQTSRVISIRGIGGVGKTSILRGIEAVNERFKDGTYLITLGADAIRERLTEEVCDAVQVSRVLGKTTNENISEMRQRNKLEHVFRDFRKFFSEKQCLFMIDDIWETSEATSNMIYGLLNVHRSGMNSKIVFTTRSREIATRAEQCFVLEPREALGAQCRSIFMLQPGIEADVANADAKNGVNRILKKCSGLPLFLTITGRAVNGLSKIPGADKSAACDLYASTLDAAMQIFFNTNVDSYERLASTLDISLQVLEDRIDRFGFCLSLSMGKMYRRLSVVESKVPMVILMYLWELRSVAEARIVAREFEQMGLISVDVETIREGRFRREESLDALVL